MKLKLVAGWVLSLALPAAAGEYYWNPASLSGFLDDGANWYSGSYTTGYAPQGGDAGKFGNQSITAPAEYTVKIPVVDGGVFTDRSSTWANGLPSGTKITFDATGTTWLKQKEQSDIWNDSKVLRFDNSDHFFNLENVNSSATDGNFGFALTDGKISFTASESGDVLAFESGTFNNYRYPLDSGTVSRHSTIIGYSVHRANSRIVFKEGSTSHLRNVQVRGASPGLEVVYEGGEHYIYDEFRIKCWDGAADAVVRVSGGRLSVQSAMWLGVNDDGDARLIVDGTGRFDLNGNVTYFPDVTSSRGFLEVKGNGLVVAPSASFAVGHATDSIGVINLSDNGALQATNTVTLAENSDRSFGALMISNNASAYIGTLHAATGGTDRRATITLADNGSLTLGGNECQWGNSDTAFVDFTMQDNATLTKTAGTISLGQWNLATVNARFLGGTVDGDNSGGGMTLNFRNGWTSTNLFDGAKVTVRNLIVQGGPERAADAENNLLGVTNVVTMRSGELNIRTCGGGDGLDIRGNRRNSMFLMEGGTLNVGMNGGGMIRIGHGGENQGYHAVFRQTGGVVREDCVVNMCDATPSCGEFELLGGVFYGREIRGWNGCVVRNPNYTRENGWARCYFNGGTLSPIRNNDRLIYTMPECSVGPAGLTVDTATLDASIIAQFQNDGAGTEAEVDGRFIKQGVGKLTLVLTEIDGGASVEYAGRSLNSSQTYLDVLGGKLVFSNPNTYTYTNAASEEVSFASTCRFGKHVTIGNGGTLSLEGDPVSLVVDTITVGNGNGFSTLYLDPGDLVYVTGENGVRGNAGALGGTFVNTLGSYDVFVCDYEPSLAELNKISVEHIDSKKAYSWTVAQNAAGKYVATFVVGEAGQAGSTIWNGSASSDWATADNWTTTVPAAGVVAQFPSSTANKTVTTAEDAVVGKMEFAGGDYSVGGTDELRVTQGIEVQAGSTTVSAPLSLGRAVTADVAGGANLTVSGALSGSGSEFVKKGSGHLLLSGDNSDFNGSIVAGGGALEVTSRAALGPETISFPLTLGGGTLWYRGLAATLGELKIAADEHMKTVILNNEQDLTFTSVSYLQGTFAKIGAGALNLVLPRGQFMLGSNAQEEYIGENGGMIEFPLNGDSPTSHSGLYGVNILEGTLRVRGAGVSATTLSTGNSAILGGGYAADVAPVLDIADAYVNWGAGSRHGCICRDYPAGCPAPKVILNNAYLWSDSCTIGQHAYGEVFPELYMTNSTFFNHYNATISNGGSAKPVVDANNSQLYNDADFGFNIAGDLKADFYGPDALFGSVSDHAMNNDWNNTRYPRGGAVCAWNNVNATLTFRDGATLAVTRGLMFRNSGCITTTFDGGVFEVRKHNGTNDCVSAMANTGVQGFTTTGDGLTVNIIDGISHGITFPIFGDGKVVKSGPGTLKLVHSYDQTHFVDNEELQDEAVKLLQHTGATEVAQGRLVVDGKVIGSTAKFQVAANATLDLNASSVSAVSYRGAGTVANGVVAAGDLLIDATGVEFLTFAGTTLPDRTHVGFDFGGEAPETKSTRVVARLTDVDGVPVESADVSGWRGATRDEGLQVYYKFAYDPATGYVTATFSNTSGAMFYLR